LGEGLRNPYELRRFGITTYLSMLCPRSMVVLRLSPSEEKKQNALAKAKGLTPEKAIRYALEETLELETQAQRFTKAGQALSNAEAEQIVVGAVRAIRQGYKMTHLVTPRSG